MSTPPDPDNQDSQKPDWTPRPVPPPSQMAPHAAQEGQVPPVPGAPYGAPQYGEPQHGAPQYGTPGAPQYGTPPQSGQPQYGAQPPYGQAQYGQPPYAQPPYDGGQYGQPFGQPPAPAPKSRKTLWIVLSVVGAVVVLAVVGVVLLVNLVGNATGKVRAQAEEFTNLLLKGSNEEAYDRFLTDSLKENLSKDSFTQGINGLDLSDSCKANYNSINAESKNGVNRTEISGTLDCNGRTIELTYGFVGKDGKMDTIRIKPRN